MTTDQFSTVIERLQEIERRLEMLTGPLVVERAREMRSMTADERRAHNKAARERAIKRSTHRVTPDRVAIAPSAGPPPPAGGAFFAEV